LCVELRHLKLVPLEDVIIRHAHIVWQVDFKKQTLAGSVKLTFEKAKDQVDKAVSEILYIYF
jgi:hypothetical protein